MVCGSCASHGRECYDWCVGHVRVMEGSVMIVTNGVGHVRVMEGSVMIVTNGVGHVRVMEGSVMIVTNGVWVHVRVMGVL